MRDAALARAQEALLSRGLTAAADMGTSLEDWQAMNRRRAAGTLPLRIFSYAGGSGELARMARRPGERAHAGDRVKLYSDGALGSRGAWLKQPYADAPQHARAAAADAADLRAQAGAALKAASRWRCMQSAMRPTTWCSRVPRRRLRHGRPALPGGACADRRRGRPRPVRHRQGDRLDAAGASDQRPDMAEARLGPKRLGGAYAWQTLAKQRTSWRSGRTSGEDPNPFRACAA
jgi:predicted amidohydrolase YtcJ